MNGRTRPAEQAIEGGGRPVHLLPWRHVLILTSAFLLPGLLGFVAADKAGSVAAVAGVAVGCFAALSAGRWGSIAAGGGLLAALSLLLVLPSLPGFIVVSAALVVAAAAEAMRAGTRVAVVVLLGAVMAATGMSQGSTAWMLPLAVSGVAAGCLAVEHLGLSTILPRAPATADAGLRLGLFLGLGVALSLVLVLAIDTHRSYWIAIMFVSRALLPLQHRPHALLRYGKGAAAGVLLAVAVEATGVADALRLLVAFAALIIGLRFLTYPIPVSSGAFTVAVLLGTAPTLAEAAFRLETVALVIGMILFLTLLLDRLWTALVDPEHGSNEESSSR